MSAGTELTPLQRNGLLYPREVAALVMTAAPGDGYQMQRLLAWLSTNAAETELQQLKTMRFAQEAERAGFANQRARLMPLETARAYENAVANVVKAFKL